MYKKAEVEYLRSLLKGLTALRKYAYMRFAQEKQAQKGKAPRFGGELFLADPVTQNRILDEIGGNLTPGTLSNLTEENVQRAANILNKGVDVFARTGISFATRGISNVARNWTNTTSRLKYFPDKYSPRLKPGLGDIWSVLESMAGNPFTRALRGARELAKQPMPHIPTYEEQKQKARELMEKYRR